MHITIIQGVDNMSFDIEKSKKQFRFLKESGYQVDEVLQLLDIFSLYKSLLF